MKTFLSLSCFFLILWITSCSQSSQPSGYWSDSSGMALFHIYPDQNEWVLKASLGELRGNLTGNKIVGLTELKDSFSFEVAGDSAVYSILGITLPYHRITKETFDQKNLEALESATKR